MELKGLKNLQGLDSLLKESQIGQVSSKENIWQLAIGQLQSGQYQPRQQMDEGGLKELAESIKAQGIILPLLVRPLSTGTYEIIAGERRWRAAQLAGLTAVPAIIKTVSDETALAFALIENIQRESLNPIDEALAFARLHQDFLLTHEEIAERVGRSRSAVTNLLRLLGLSREVQDLLRSHQLEMGHARALLGLEQTAQCELARQIVAHAYSVRQAENLVRQGRQVKKEHAGSKKQSNISQIAQWESQLGQLLATHVKVNLNAKGNGKVVIYVDSPDAVEALVTICQKPRDSSIID